MSNKRYGKQGLQNKKEPSYMIENTANIEQIQISRDQWESCLSPGISPSEYLSIVIVTRVDNYAG